MQANENDPVNLTGEQFCSIKSSFAYHYDNCGAYRRYCDQSGFHPKQLMQAQDIEQIPLIPTQMFKSCDIRSVAKEEIVKVCTSSGTRGSVSKVPRDAKTLETFKRGTASRIAETLTPSAKEYTMLCLGPQQEEAKDLWIAYILSLLSGVTAKQVYYVKDDRFLLPELIQDLKRAEQTQEKLALIGPPMFFVHLCDALRKNGEKLRLHPESLLMTMGGWKKDEERALSRSEMEQNALEVLGLPAAQCRDGYGAVELNSVLFDCINKHKHLPNWVTAVARDPDTLRPLGYGEEGILSFIDTSASSYPCFILTEDFGTVHPGHACGCGVSGDSVTVSRRISRVESKGCALKMNRTEVASV